MPVTTTMDEKLNTIPPVCLSNVMSKFGYPNLCSALVCGKVTMVLQNSMTQGWGDEYKT